MNQSGDGLTPFVILSPQAKDLLAAEHVTRSVTIYASIGIVAGELQPEIWKVIEW